MGLSPSRPACHLYSHSPICRSDLWLSMLLALGADVQGECNMARQPDVFARVRTTEAQMAAQLWDASHDLLLLQCMARPQICSKATKPLRLALRTGMNTAGSVLEACFITLMRMRHVHSDPCWAFCARLTSCLIAPQTEQVNRASSMAMASQQSCSREQICSAGEAVDV